ncbi:hypothetical protein ALC56_03435 [Trachymyrmex septentrionalis]|uniref:Uncharacterized protein n=1 Tax=Trachymyrmex septentrionalis TaxID=34720 RepID=A0A195FPR4_9HYME|nr:hypothetical protein ALC56_03435 [Trachymyrmex septentrionalis]
MKPTRPSSKGSAIRVVGFSVRLHRHQEWSRDVSGFSRANDPRNSRSCEGLACLPARDDVGTGRNRVSTRKDVGEGVGPRVGLQDGRPDDFLATMSDVTRPSRRDAPHSVTRSRFTAVPGPYSEESLLSTRPRNGTRQM